MQLPNFFKPGTEAEAEVRSMRAGNRPGLPDTFKHCSTPIYVYSVDVSQGRTHIGLGNSNNEKKKRAT